MGRVRRYTATLMGTIIRLAMAVAVFPRSPLRMGARRDGGATVRVLGADNLLISLWYSSLASYHIRAGMCDP
jgi:hypothetical protein